MKKNDKKLTSEEFSLAEAALLLSMSPELLTWFVSYSPKKDDLRKLQVSRHVEGMPMFEKSELLDFNRWLAKPWPSPAGKRPTIPTGIKNEIVAEAGNLCAICFQHTNACEAAHIDPVAQSKNNHPHNLIYLCASHHTTYDKGLIGPLEKDKDFVKHLKGVLLGRSRMAYEITAGAVRTAFHILENCRRASELDPKTPEQRKVVEGVGKEILKQIAEVAKKKPTQESAKGFDAFLKLGQLTASTVFVEETSVKKRLRALTDFREEFRLAAGMTDCPLCEGSGNRAGCDCPYCGGEGAVTQRIADVFDQRDFDYVACPLCDGTGKHGGYDECPMCHGDCEMEKRVADRARVDDYAYVECPLCEGSGEYADYDECPYCQGNREVEARHIDNFDRSAYELTECDLCEGEGVADGFEICPKCGGEGSLSGGDSERRDKRDFKMVSCPVCDGGGSGEYGDCTQCGGEGRIPKYVKDQL